MTAQRIYDTVADDFSRVNDLIIKRLASDVPLVEKIAQYIIESGGKRLRPLLVLLASQAAGYQKDDHLKLAAVIEFLHTATLLHDDVVDTSDMRRGRSTEPPVDIPMDAVAEGVVMHEEDGITTI